MKKTLLFFALIICFHKSYCQVDKNKVHKANIIAKKYLLQNKIPGMSISVSKKGKLIWSKGFGYSDLKNRTKVVPSKTKFRIASVSKTLTALALAKLVDAKKIELDSSLYKYVPDFPKKEYDFTIRQLGGHLAGIRHYRGKEFLINKKMSIVEGLDVFKNSDLLLKPQTKFIYSTYGWNLLSVVIQNASQQDYFKYMNEQVFYPLRMKNTEVEKIDKTILNKTKFYIKRNGKIKEGPSVNNEFKAAGGGFLSTSEDLVSFGNEFIYKKIISKASLKELVTPQITLSKRSTNYGIGIAISKINNTLKYSHSGGGVGASSYLLIYPEKEVVISILTNLSGVGLKNFIKNLEAIFVID